ncbi:hypothetical protein VTG60DRAFT_4797 [Thermothelomyces hinnuleus]
MPPRPSEEEETAPRFVSPAYTVSQDCADEQKMRSQRLRVALCGDRPPRWGRKRSLDTGGGNEDGRAGGSKRTTLAKGVLGGGHAAGSDLSAISSPKISPPAAQYSEQLSNMQQQAAQMGQMNPIQQAAQRQFLAAQQAARNQNMMAMNGMTPARMLAMRQIYLDQLRQQLPLQEQQLRQQEQQLLQQELQLLQQELQLQHQLLEQEQPQQEEQQLQQEQQLLQQELQLLQQKAQLQHQKVQLQQQLLQREQQLWQQLLQQELQLQHELKQLRQ